MKYLFFITPVAKPRMTRQDKWTKRSIVQAYWQYKDDLQRLCLEKKYHLEDTLTIEFYLPMPKSWSERKKQKMSGQPHQQTPDIDNLLKGFLDALRDNDASIWQVTAKKYWAYEGLISVKQEE